MDRSFEYRFRWDPVKAKQNTTKHGVTFGRAASIFRDRRAVSIYDDNHSRDEDRWLTLGMDATGTLLVVSHTFILESDGSAQVRLISARRATKKEFETYLKGA